MTIRRRYIKSDYRPFYVVGENKEFRTLFELKRTYGIKELTRTGKRIEIVNGKKFIYEEYKPNS